MKLRSRSHLDGGGIFFAPPPLSDATVTIWFILTVLFAGRTTAQENGEEKDDIEVVEIRASRLPEVSVHPSAMVTVLEVEDFGPGMVTTSAMARAAPAVRTREHGGLGQLTTVGVRGAAPHQTLVAIDGVPLPDSMGAGVDLSQIPAAFLDRVEILRGATSAWYGSGAMGGVINLVTRTSEFPDWWGRLSGGSFGTWMGSAGAVFESRHSHFLIISSLLSTAGDFRFVDNRQTPYNPFDDREMVRKNNQAKTGSLLLKTKTHLPLGATLELTCQATALDRGIAGLLGFTARQAQETGWYGVFDIRTRLPAGEGLVEGGVDLLVNGRRLQDPLGELTGVVVNSRQELWSADGFVATLFPLGRHLVRTRLEFGQMKLNDPGFGAPSRLSVAVNLGAELKIAHDRLGIFPWARLENHSDTGWQLAPGLGTAYWLTPSLVFKANLGRFYRVPNFNELYLEGGFAVGNPNLAPEVGWSLDVGIEWTYVKMLQVALAGFTSHFQELIVFEPTSNFRYKPLNTGGANLSGIELESRVFPTRELQLSASYTLLLSVDRSGQPNREGHELPGRPRHSTSLSLDWHWGRLLVEADFCFVGGNFTNQANTKKLASRLLFDTGLGIEPREGVIVMLQAKNLLNDQIQDVRGLPLPGISFFLTVGFTKGGQS